MRITLILCFMCFTAATKCAAVKYNNARLQHISNAVGVDLSNASSPFINNDSTWKYNNRLLRICTNSLSDVNHIGYRLFDNQILESCISKEALLFIERYLLELDLKLDNNSVEQRLKLDEVTIVDGTANMFSLINSSLQCNLEYQKRRMYRIQWVIGKQKLTIVFPADCQLIRGANAIELEDILNRDLDRYHENPANNYLLSWKNAKSSFSGNMKIMDNGYYVNRLIKSKIYLRLKDSKWELINSQNMKLYSISNTMLTGHSAKLIPMTIKLDKYGYKSTDIKIFLQQFMAFCNEDNCKTYIGIKEVNEKFITGTMFYFNEYLGYNHILSFKFPLSLLFNQEGTIDARLYAYIPLQNLTEDFFKQNLFIESEYEN